MRCSIQWDHTRYRDHREGKPRKFTSEVAKGYDIAANDFSRTITWKQLVTKNRYDTLWVGTLPTGTSEKVAFYFPDSIDSIKVANIIGYKQKWTGSDTIPPGPDQPVVTTQSTFGDRSIDATECSGLRCLEHQPTVAGVIVGIIGALIVVALVASILIWRKRQQDHRGNHYP